MGKHELKMDHALKLDEKKSDLNKDGKLSEYERKRGTAIAEAMKMGGSKGEFYMKPGHSNSKSMSELNMSNKDELMMKALYMHTGDPHPTDKLASYTETTTDVKRTGPSAASSNVQKSTSNLADYQKGLKDLGPDFKPTAAQTAAANAKVAELKKKDAEAKAFNESQSKSSPGSITKSTKSVTKTVGEKTQKEILDKGTEFKSNYKSRLGAERKAAMDKSQGDSIKVAKKMIKEVSKYKKLDQNVLDAAHRAGQAAGAKSLKEAKGSQGEKLFSTGDIDIAYGARRRNAAIGSAGSSASALPEYDKVLENPNKKKSKRNKLISVPTGRVKSSGTLGSRPMLSDFEMKPLKMSYYGNKKK